MRFDSYAKCSFDDQDNYPFDTMMSQFSMEISHFDLTDDENRSIAFRFDCYKPSDWCSFKPDVEGMPQFILDKANCEMWSIKERKTVKVAG